MNKPSEPPTLCAKTNNPYTYCPLVFVHEDDFILAMLSMTMQDIKRLAGLDGTSLSGEEAVMLDSRCKELTAYMNGRIDEVIRLFKTKKEPDILFSNNLKPSRMLEDE